MSAALLSQSRWGTNKFAGWHCTVSAATATEAEAAVGHLGLVADVAECPDGFAVLIVDDETTPFRREINEPWIVIRKEGFGEAVEVVIIPTPLVVGHDCEFRSHAAAIEYARRLSRTMGWRIHDQIGGAA